MKQAVVAAVIASVVVASITLYVCQWTIERRFERVGHKLEGEQVLEQRLDALDAAIEKMNSRDVQGIGREVDDIAAVRAALKAIDDRLDRMAMAIAEDHGRR